MNDVIIGAGKLAGKGIYAARDFQEGEVVIHYNLRELTQEEFNALPTRERMFTHSFWRKIYLYPEPSRYVNHSPKPNTYQDLKNMCDFASRSIKKGEMITTNATKEVQNELETFIENYEQTTPKFFRWVRGGYRNAICTYTIKGKSKQLTLKRINGNWRIIKES